MRQVWREIAFANFVVQRQAADRVEGAVVQLGLPQRPLGPVTALVVFAHFLAENFLGHTRKAHRVAAAHFNHLVKVDYVLVFDLRPECFVQYPNVGGESVPDFRDFRVVEESLDEIDKLWTPCHCNAVKNPDGLGI